MVPLVTGFFAPPSAAKPVEPKPLSVMIGRFYPQEKTSNNRTNLGARYQTRFHIGNLPAPLVYLDSSRKKNVTNLTATTTSTQVTTLQGLGLSWRTNQPTLFGKNGYTLKGLGLYQQRVSVDDVHRTGYSLGVKLGVGYQKEDLFAEANYTLVGRIKGTDPSGFMLSVGFRL